MALELLGGELIDTEMVLESRGPANGSGSGGLTLAERLARIETAINRLDEHMNDRVATLERRVSALETLNPVRLIDEFRDVQRRLGDLERGGSREAQVAVVKIERLEDRLAVVERKTWGADEVQIALNSYKRWLLALAGFGIALLSLVLSNTYFAHTK